MINHIWVVCSGWEGMQWWVLVSFDFSCVFPTLRAVVILSVDATDALMASEISNVVGMKAVPQTQRPQAMGESLHSALHCVRTASYF